MIISCSRVSPSSGPYLGMVALLKAGRGGARRKLCSFQGQNDHINMRVLHSMVSGAPLVFGLSSRHVGSLCLCGFWGGLDFGRSVGSVGACGDPQQVLTLGSFPIPVWVIQLEGPELVVSRLRRPNYSYNHGPWLSYPIPSASNPMKDHICEGLWAERPYLFRTQMPRDTAIYDQPPNSSTVEALDSHLLEVSQPATGKG